MITLTGLTACQSLTNATPTPQAVSVAKDTLTFDITGKIGVTQMTATGTQAGSAFYAWGQRGNRFAIDLTGALGMGATNIRYNGTEATLTSEQTGTITADTPEALLMAATGWQAPISLLPYWVMGKPTPSDTQSEHDEQGRLTSTQNNQWTATLDYQDNRSHPSRLRITHVDGHRVVMTIHAQ